MSATVLAAVYTTDTATTPTSDTSPTTSRGFGALIVLADGVLDTVGATAAIFAAASCESGVDAVDASVVDGCGSSVTGLTGLTDATVSLGRCVLRRVVGFLLPLVVSSTVGALASGDASVSVSDVVGASAFGVFGVLGAFGPFGASAELSDVESPFEGDGSSAWAIPLVSPTATQADKTKAATVNRSHQ